MLIYIHYNMDKQKAVIYYELIILRSNRSGTVYLFSAKVGQLRKFLNCGFDDVGWVVERASDP